MSCPIETELTAYLDGELDAPTLKKVQAHLGTCRECQETDALLRRTVAQLSLLPELEPAVGARRAFMARLDAERDPWRVQLRALLRPAVWVPASGVLTAAAVALVLVHPWRPHAGGGGELDMARQMELAANLEVAENYEVLGMESPDDVDVVAHLSELEHEP